MREIKFRGKSAYTGQWIYGDLIHYSDDSLSILESPFTQYGCEATEILKRDLIIAYTEGQYTGLKDKNGKEIYEGDIVKYMDMIHPVTLAYYHGLKCMWGRDETVRDYAIDGEIIGNIYENPELLEKNR